MKFIVYGLKWGKPSEKMDFDFDCRELQNPHQLLSLKHKNGFDSAVIRYVHLSDSYFTFIGHITDTLIKYKPNTVGFFCTGGRHRSVVVVNDILGYLALGRSDSLNIFGIEVEYRDLNKRS